MRQYSVFIFVSAVAAFLRVADGSIVVSDWGLTTGVQDDNFHNYYQFSNVVSNPFGATQRVDFGQSWAQTTFDFSWKDTAGNFSIDASLGADADGAQYFLSASDGTFILTPTSDLLLTMSSFYSYHLPVFLMSAGFDFCVSDPLPPHDPALCETFSENTGLEAPIDHTHTTSGQVLLIAGQTYEIGYRMHLNSFGTSGPRATADGHIEFTLHEVPEPVAFLPIALGAALIWRRHTNRLR